MAITVREMRTEEARRFLEIHHEAIRGIAVRDYPSAVIDLWAGPITDAAIERFLVNRDDELRLLAEVDGEPVGIGAIVLANCELRACYVAPHAARHGVGTAIVAEIERIARAHGLRYLQLESSITAKAFYRALGYEVEGRGELRLSAGVAMAAIKMRKRLE